MSDARFIDYLGAAADFFGPGSLEVPQYQSEITDLVRRRGAFGQRIRKVPATGHPSRYFEQTRIVKGGFQDPRNLKHEPGNDPTRRERVLHLKSIYAPINFGLFDVELTRQQSTQFSMLVAKDLNDAIEGCLYVSDQALWNGSDTDLAVPSTSEYVGLITQINRTATIASTASIVDGLKAEIADMMADENFNVRPTAIYLNPIACDLIDQEERLNHRQQPQAPNEVIAGLRVPGLATTAGILPLIPDWSLKNGASGASSTESGKTDYKAMIVTESLIEYHYLTTPDPRVFQLGLEGNLQTRYAVVLFGAPVAKGKANAAQAQNVTETGLTTYSHSYVTIVR